MEDAPIPGPTPVETPLEDRVRAALDAGVDAVDGRDGAPAGDPADLARRRARHHQRRRAVRSAAAAAIVLVAAVGGWAVGRDGGSGDDIERVVGPDPSTTAPVAPPARRDGVVPSGADLPVVGAATAGGFAAGVGGTVGSEGAGGTPAPPLPPDSGASVFAPEAIVSAAGGGARWLPPGGDVERPSAPLFDRTLPDGTVLDVRSNVVDPSTHDVAPFWEPPGWCFPAGDVYVGARLPDAVGQAYAVRYADVPPGRVLATTTVVGGPEDTPQWISVVQGPAGTTRLRATFPGGGVDEMEPVEGVAVLSAPVAEGVDLTRTDEPDALPDLAVEALAADGSTVARVELDALWPDLAWSMAEGVDGCTPPTELPAPGPQQPADPAAADAAVRAVWDTAFARPGSVTPEEQRTYVDDATGLEEAMAEVRDTYDEAFLSTVSIPVRGVVFADPETAYLEYVVQVGSTSSTFDDRFAELHLVAGAWKVTRASACSLLALGGGSCEPLGDG